MLAAGDIRVSSACTGAYTAELALGVLEKTINDTKVLTRQVTFIPKSSHDAWFQISRVD